MSVSPPRDAAGDLHVRPDERTGAWLVEPEHAPVLSSHRTADEAASAALSRAAARGDRHIYVHDRYRRVRAITAR